MFEIIYNTLIFFVSLIVAMFVGRSFRMKYSISLLIFLWHTLFATVFYWYSLNFITDAKMYYRYSLYDDLSVNLGGDFIIYFTSFFSKILDFSYFGCYLVYNLIGTIGVYFLASVLLKLVQYPNKNNKWIYMFLFLPSLSYWSTAIGKDTFSFLAICLSIWSMVGKPKYVAFSLSVLIMLLVRPHMAGIMLIALILSIILSKQSKFIVRFLLGGLGLIIASVMIPYALQYAGLKGSVDVASVSKYVEQRQSYNLEGGSSVNISEMSFPMQLITYVFRPFPFEVHSAFALFTSLENLFLLWLFIKAVILKRKKNMIKLIDYNKIYLLSYLVVSWSILALTTANLGIATRQKWMFVPVLYVLIFNIIMSKKKIV